MKIELSGRFKIEAIRPDGSKRVLAEWFPNLILDAGLNRIGSGGFMNRCMVGSSSTAPLVGQTTLVTPVASTDTVLGTSFGTELASNYCYARSTYRFGAGAAAGNLSEVGVGWSASACFSRALIVDGGGTPTSITVLSDEILDVTYEFRQYWPTGDGTATLSVNSVNYSVVSRACHVGDWAITMHRFIGNGSNDLSTFYFGARSYRGGTPANLGGITLDPGMTDNGDGTLSYGASYVNNSYERGYVASFDPGIVNPITAVRVYGSMGIFKLSIDPAMPKDNTNTFSVNVKYTWARKAI